jgi:hypothetical protein
MNLRSRRRWKMLQGPAAFALIAGGTDPYFNGNQTARSRNANETNPLDDDYNIKPHETRSTRPPKIPKVISIQSVEKRHATMESLSPRRGLLSS